MSIFAFLGVLEAEAGFCGSDELLQEWSCYRSRHRLFSKKHYVVAKLRYFQRAANRLGWSDATASRAYQLLLRSSLSQNDRLNFVKLE